jgi:hypothetical protein
MKLLKALLAQLLGAALTLLLAWRLPGFMHGMWFLVLTQGFIAAACSSLLRQPIWWVPIHLLFLPGALILLTLQLPSWLYLMAALLLTLIFWGTFKGDVPLFLSSTAVVDALKALVEKEQSKQFVELGAGVGSVVIPLAKHRPAMTVTAYERAPLPWIITAWRSRKLSNLTVQRSSFWACDLGRYDVVFAFLSPDPMPELGEKIKREMRPGSLFIASSFPVPHWQPERIQQIQDRRGTRLYCYRIR